MSLSNPIQVNAQVQESSSTNPKSSKRKVTEDRQEEEEEEGSESDGDSDSEEVTHINTTFTFVAPTSIDFHALKALLNQLFHTHSQDDSKININTLTNGILERAGVDLEAENGTGNGGQQDAEMKIKPSVGTVVKVEGEEGDAEGDPFAMISAVDLKSTSTDPSSTNLRSYFLSTLPKSSKISSLLSSISSSITLLLHSRLSNLPFQISIPCYRLIHSEQSELLKEKNESLPEYAMLFSRCFKLNANHWENEDEGGDDEDKPRGMKKRKGGKKDKKSTGNKTGGVGEGNQIGSDALGYFNPEDEIVSKFASHVETFSFPAPKSADPSLFEAPLLGLVALVKWEKIPEIVDQIEVEVERMGQRLNGAVDEEAMGLD